MSTMASRASGESAWRPPRPRSSNNRAIEERSDVVIGKLWSSTTRDRDYERGVHLEKRVFGRGAYEHDDAVFHRIGGARLAGRGLNRWISSTNRIVRRP